MRPIGAPVDIRRHRAGVTTEGNEMEKMLLTPEEAADALSISRATVYDLMRARALHSVKIGRARRVPTSAVRDYVSRLLEDGF